MARKPKYLQTDHNPRDRWMVSYTDMVTVLLILFVAVAAQAFQKKVAPPPPPPKPAARKVVIAPPPPPNPLLKVEQDLAARGLNPHMEPRGLVISLPESILFPSGEDEITPSAYPLISHIADVLRGIPNKVTLVGHADAIPIHNRRFRNNWELSAARSLRLLEVLSGRYGVAEERLSAASDGSYSPKESNATAAGRAENRRVEIVILGGPPA
jgi:chemotaxis protein MotB